MPGAEAEYARIPLADGTLVATPGLPDDDLVPSLLAASDVLGIGWFAAVAAEVGPGKTVAVVGDGAVGLLGVLAAKQLGARGPDRVEAQQVSVMCAGQAPVPVPVSHYPRSRAGPTGAPGRRT